MKLKIGNIALFMFTFCVCSWGQDIHWSQFNDNPIFLNPALAGNFKGDYRFVSNYRNQWKSVTVPFTTFNFSTDFRPSKMQKIGLGFLFFNDQAGDGKFRTIELQSNLSYKISLDTNQKNTITPGINIGLNSRQVNFNLLSFDNQYNGITYDPTIPSNELYGTQRNTNFSIGLGAVFEHQITEKENITAGIGCFNLNRPNQGFYNDVVQRDIRTSIFLKGNFKLNYDWNILPSLQINVQGKYNEVVLGASAKLTLLEHLGNYRAVYFGGWMRNKDAFYLSTGMDYQSWFVGLSYDINVSKLVPASNFRGGFEIAVRYILFRFKPKKINHRICPDYI